MKKFSILTLVMIISGGLFAACSSPDVMAHGTIQFVNVETGCWEFLADDGTSYELIYAPQNILRDGLTGVLSGTYADLMTFCMVGTPINICNFDADQTQNIVGTLRYLQLEGGCWVIDSGSKSYVPLSKDPSFFRDGAKVKVAGMVRDDMLSICMSGPVVEVVSYEFIGACPSQCDQTFRSCERDCAEVFCFVSCDTVRDICLNGCFN